jgi:hypothetical protein
MRTRREEHVRATPAGSGVNITPHVDDIASKLASARS